MNGSLTSWVSRGGFSEQWSRVSGSVTSLVSKEVSSVSSGVGSVDQLPVG